MTTHAIVITGHGSLRSASGAAMLRLAARVREQSGAPIVEAGFFNFSRPTLAEALVKSIEQGATALTVQPYFLIAGHYVSEDLPRQIRTVMAAYPDVPVAIAEPFLDHPAMAQLVVTRAAEVDPDLGQVDGEAAAALLLMAHGTPWSDANDPIFAVARQVDEATDYAPVDVCFMEHNEPDIPTAIARAAAQGRNKIVMLPYFLHLGRHTVDDLPRIVAAAQDAHPACEILLGPHLGYDLRLVDVMTDRIRTAKPLRLDRDSCHG